MTIAYYFFSKLIPSDITADDSLITALFNVVDSANALWIVLVQVH